MKYNVNIVEVGSNVEDMLKTGLLILFNQSAPEDLKPFCVVTEENKQDGQVESDDVVTIANRKYKVTSVGDVANENLYLLGHVSLCFDGAKEAQLPGHIHLTPGFESDLSNLGKITIK
ncbi:PTS glucitol/sorbitol transporter subunit IIA [Oceanobacillus sp. FSL K6-0251]|uniref:PTS glucitol/sorbitol transporter subunit IIA n=1 Tax=Oceanobacillus sp. FSL K6-0251 TaxID=2921602 RepID=UPI0030F973CF